MLELNIAIENLDIFKDMDILDVLDDVLKDIMETIKQDIIELSPIGERKHDYPRFREQWSVIQKEEGGYSFSNPAPYAHRLEYGTWPGVGPRTAEAAHAITGERGIFSSQTVRGAVAGIVGLYLSDENRIQWIADEITKRVKEEIEKTK